MGRLVAALILVGILASVTRAEETAFPPGWLPVAQLEATEPSWSEFRDIKDRVHLYLPGGDKSVRGVFVCFVFHSGDPRELARLWNFALVTVPWPMEYDLGHNDKRNGRFKLGHEPQDMGLLLRYLDQAAEETGHAELKTVPLVGWLGQNGSHLAGDLYERAPDRLLAWSDSFANRLREYPELTQNVPFAFAWEISRREEREGVREIKDEPLLDLSCRASTYGFGHGIYSKFNFFVAYLDRCIALRMPETMPPGEPFRLKPVVRSEGWVGDFAPVGAWNPIVPADSPEAESFKYPSWMPDEYSAWTWRSYHSTAPNILLTGPRVEYRKKDGKWGGPDCGLGYGGPIDASEPQTFSAKVGDGYERVEFHDGDKIVGTATGPDWTVQGVRLDTGLRALFVVGVRPDGSKAASRPAFVIVKETP